MLSVLHEADSRIPDKDNNGRKLSYTYVVNNAQPDNDLKFLPIEYDDVLKLRHAVSPIALHENIDTVNYINSTFKNSVPKRRFKRTTREEIRYSFNLADFIGDIDENREDKGNESLESILKEISLILLPEDFVTNDINFETEGKNIFHLIAKNYKEYFDLAAIIYVLCVWC